MAAERNPIEEQKMRRIVICCAVLAVMVVSGCMTGRGVVSKAAVSFEDGSKYDGQLVNGVPEGHGSIVFPEGGKYTGEFKNGMMDGEGVYNYPNGSTYEGSFKKGLRHGKGVYTRPFQNTTGTCPADSRCAQTPR